MIGLRPEVSAALVENGFAGIRPLGSVRWRTGIETQELHMKTFLALALTVAFAAPALAAEKCPKPEAMNRKTRIALLIKASHTGYRDIRIVEDCGRYQVRATRDGVKTRVWYDPATLQIIPVNPGS